MKPKTMILMGLAIVCGLGASFMTRQLLAGRQVDDVERVKILVARKNLNVFEQISKPEEMFEESFIDKKDDAPDLIRDFDAVRGKRLRLSRNKGDRVTFANLYDKVGLDIPEGHQAVGCPVNLQTTAHGLATLPGSFVDLTLTVKGPDFKTTFSRTVMERVLVLAADTRVTPEGEIVAPAQVVTFALKEEDKLRMSVAKELGIITLSLRRNGDNTPGKTIQMTAEEMLGRKDEVKDAPVVVKEAKPPVVVPEPKSIVEEPRVKTTSYSTLIINGSQIQTISGQFNDDGEQVDGEPSIPRTGAIRGNLKKNNEPSDQ